MVTFIAEERVPEKKVKVEAPGLGSVDASEVTVEESTERWTDVKLGDGTHLRIKPVVVTAARLDNRYDGDGNPVYLVRVNQIMSVVSAPDILKAAAATKASKPN
jgi:hypothetical protein